MLTAEAYPELPSCFDDHATPRRENGHPRPSDPLSTRQRWRRARPCRRLEVGVSLSTPIRVPVYFQLTTLTRRILRPDSRTHAATSARRRGARRPGARRLVFPCLPQPPDPRRDPGPKRPRAAVVRGHANASNPRYNYNFNYRYHCWYYYGLHPVYIYRYQGNRLGKVLSIQCYPSLKFPGTPLVEGVSSPGLAQWGGDGRAARVAPRGTVTVPPHLGRITSHPRITSASIYPYNWGPHACPRSMGGDAGSAARVASRGKATVPPHPGEIRSHPRIRNLIIHVQLERIADGVKSPTPGAPVAGFGQASVSRRVYGPVLRSGSLSNISNFNKSVTKTMVLPDDSTPHVVGASNPLTPLLARVGGVSKRSQQVHDLSNICVVYIE